MAFLKGAVKPPLYIGMTKTNASAESTRALHSRVCALAYTPLEAYSGSSRKGRAISARSTEVTSKPPCARACSPTHAASGRPEEVGRVAAEMTCRRVMCGELP